MFPDLVVSPEELRGAAVRAADVAATVEGMALPDIVAGRGPAVPGGRAATAAAALSAAWRGRVDAWSAKVTAYADALDSAAEGYVIGDGWAADALGRLWRW